VRYLRRCSDETDPNSSVPSLAGNLKSRTEICAEDCVSLTDWIGNWEDSADYFGRQNIGELTDLSGFAGRSKPAPTKRASYTAQSPTTETESGYYRASASSSSSSSREMIASPRFGFQTEENSEIPEFSAVELFSTESCCDEDIDPPRPHSGCIVVHSKGPLLQPTSTNKIACVECKELVATAENKAQGTTFEYSCGCVLQCEACCVEVKGPNDRLAAKQITWLHLLNVSGCPSAVGHVAES
jgi:ferredoxin